jgi:hypothetical protein
MNRLLLGALFLTGCATSVDPKAARAYPCDPDGGALQCPGGWKCGLEGYCHEPNAPQPFACRDDSDCASDWRCGLNAICHDRNAGAAYQCVSSRDCERGWRCGLTGDCHDPAIAAAYPCNLDSDCEQSWRCNVDSVCAPASADALRKDADAGQLAMVRVSPLTSVGYPDLASAGRPDASSFGVDAPYAIANGNVLTLVRHSPQGRIEVLPDGGYTLFFAEAVQATLPFGSPRALVTWEGRAYFLDDGGLGKLVASKDGGVLSRISPPVTGTELRMSPDEMPLLIAFDKDSFSLIDPSSDTVLKTGLSLPSMDGGRQRIFDMMPAFSTKNQDPVSLWILAAGEEGLFVARRSAQGALVFADGGAAAGGLAWAPTQFSPLLPNLRCSGGLDGGVLAKALHFSEGAPYLGFGIETEGPVAGVVTILADEPFSACGNPYGFTTLACALCPQGYRLGDLSAHSSVPPSLVAGCISADGKSKETYLSGRNPNDGGCQLISRIDGLAPYSEPARQNRSLVGYQNLSGAHGQLWSGPNLTALALDQPATFFTPVLELGERAQVRIAGALSQNFFETPGIGLARFDGRLDDQLAAVDGKPDWGIFTSHEIPEVVGGLTTPAQLQVTFPSFSDPGPPYTALVAALPDGGSQLVVSVFDKLLAAELLPDAGAVLEIKRVPLPFSPILSVAISARPLTAPDGGHPLHTGYVLTRNRLFALVASSPKVWDTHEIAMPEGDWKRVWFDGQRGRIGYASGVVYGLPSRAPLADALSDGEQLNDFVQLCGSTYGLSSQGRLLRLELPGDGGALGHWVTVDLSSALAPGTDPGLAGATLVSNGRNLIVSTTHGEVVRVRPESCP